MNIDNNDDVQNLKDLMSEQFVGSLNNEYTRHEMQDFLVTYAKKVYQYTVEVK